MKKYNINFSDPTYEALKRYADRMDIPFTEAHRRILDESLGVHDTIRTEVEPTPLDEPSRYRKLHMNEYRLRRRVAKLEAQMDLVEEALGHQAEQEAPTDDLNAVLLQVLDGTTDVNSRGGELAETYSKQVLQDAADNPELAVSRLASLLWLAHVYLEGVSALVRRKALSPDAAQDYVRVMQFVATLQDSAQAAFERVRELEGSERG